MSAVQHQTTALANYGMSKLPDKIAATILAVIRAAPLYRPDVVLLVGSAARRATSLLAPAHWDFAEQVALSAADVGQWDLYDEIVNEIDARFPESRRLQVIRGIAAEAKCEWQNAMSIYRSVAEPDSTQPHVYKRQVAVLKSEKKLPEAIAYLNYYLESFAGDREAWAELCDLCLRCGRFSHALFAANEVLITQPNNHASHLLVADVYMTIGEADALLAARRHYAASFARKSGGNLRALYGLWVSAVSIRGENGSSGEQGAVAHDGAGSALGLAEAENDRTIAWAAAAIQFTYSAVLRSSKGRSRFDSVVVARMLGSPMRDQQRW
jgi:tetratricopeptide (TPR) repeat protein